MSTLGNVLWFIFGGFFSSVGWFLSGVLVSLTIVGIPFGVQCFKIAGFVMFPFGRDVELGHFGAAGLLANVVWIIVLGWELFVSHIVAGVLLCITIIGIPFGLQHFKLAKLAILPFGARIYSL